MSVPILRLFSSVSSSAKVSKRTVCVSHKCPPNFPVVVENFSTNRIITSKYTAWNFLFKNLFEQFRRVANFYFLCIAIVQLSIASPVSPVTSLLPLIFVVSVTAVKQAYEDWLRHKADDLVNHRPQTILKKETLIAVKSEDIRVGDIVRVENDFESPCDLVLLSSSNSDGHCHVTTANLDGETNLKDQVCSDDTKDLETARQLDNLRAIIDCDSPTPDLYSFHGKITVFSPNNEKKVSSLSEKNLLLKGATLKNTEYVYGCAIYTGPDTKLVLNLKFTSSKFSTVEKSLNNFLLIFLVVLAIEASACTTLLLVVDAKTAEREWYIPNDADLSISKVISDFLSFAVLFNYIIPISLYVTLDLIKFIGALFFVWDIDMYDEKSDEPAVCNSSDLNEELGQVEYLFTDKTGTITENCMVFRECSIGGSKFIQQNGKLCPLGNDLVSLEVIEHFLLVLVLCNTVQICEGPRDSVTPLQYFASSPDEKALVEACARFGVVLQDISNQGCTVFSQAGIRFYKKLCILEFDAERKRMSTIIQDDKGSIFLLCKGADSSVLNLIMSGKKTEIKQHVSEYAVAGLRTLVIAEKEMTQADYRAFNTQLQHARCSLQDRERMVAHVYSTVEQNLHLIGATAIQDRLQEKVADTMECLQAAGIKIWILTGDHADTALNVSYACGHMKESMVKLTVLEQSNSDECFYCLRQLRCRIMEDSSRQYFLVIDGMSVDFALKDSDLLRSISELCAAVLCCRMSPLQKSQMVKLMKNAPSHPITAAIGDGANDVSMIQEAHVGIGIIGREGRQAVRCSDFALSRFHYLKKALLVHGQYYYTRAAMLVQYFFYKNVTFVLPQFLYIFFNGYTPQPIYDAAFLMMYNIFFTSLPVFIYGFTEKQNSEIELMNNPSLYRKITRNRMLTYSQFAKWMLLGIWHGLVCFFGTLLLWKDSPIIPSSGQTLGRSSFGISLFPIVVVITNLKLALYARYWTLFFLIGLIISFVSFVSYSLLYSGIYWSVKSSTLFYVYFETLGECQIWFLSIVLIVMALLPDTILMLMEKHNLKPLSTLYNVFNLINQPHKYFQFAFTKHNSECDVTISQINILRDTSEAGN